MCSELKKMLKPVCLWQWCFNFRGSGSKSFTFQRPPNIRGELSEKWIFSVQVLKVVIIWSWGVGVKTGSSSSSTCPALLLPCPLLFPHLYRMISEKEIEWFLWRASWFCAMEEVYGSQSVSRFLRIMLLSYRFWSHNVPFVFLFPISFRKKIMIIILPGRKYPAASARRLHRRMQWLILTAGIRIKNIMSEASEAGFNISLYLFIHFSNLFLAAILFSWTSHPTTIPATSLQLPALNILHTAVSPTSPDFISPWRLPSSQPISGSYKANTLSRQNH